MRSTFFSFSRLLFFSIRSFKTSLEQLFFLALLLRPDENKPGRSLLSPEDAERSRRQMREAKNSQAFYC
jgi:hypothetical protein